MFPKIIKSEDEYVKVLSRINTLMDAAPGTPEGDELEVLSALTKIYEDAHHPISLPDPIEAIKFRMEQLGLKQRDLIPCFGTKSRASEVLNRKRTLTLSMIRSLHDKLDIPADILLNQPGEELPFSPIDIEWNRFPIREMIKRGWIVDVGDPRGKEEEIMRSYIQKAGGFDNIAISQFRKGVGTKQNDKASQYALVAWCLRAIIHAQELAGDRITKVQNISFDDLRTVSRLSILENGPTQARDYLAKQGVILIYVLHLPNTRLDGAAFLYEGKNPIISLTLRYDRLDYFWFCLLHELAHVIKHLPKKKDRLIVDHLEIFSPSKGKKDPEEEEANKLAQEALIPEKEWNDFLAKGNYGASEILSFSRKLRIHPSIVAGRFRYEQHNYRIFSHLLGNREVRKHFN